METIVKTANTKKRRVGIVGLGNLGQFLIDSIIESEHLELAFVWNRTPKNVSKTIEKDLILENLDDFHQRNADLIVEVAHPIITQTYGEKFLQHADYLVGSPSALASPGLQEALCAAAVTHGLYVPAGALWGGDDIRKMADRGLLQAVRITMTFHPTSFRLCGELKEKNDKVTDEKTTLYKGPVRALCPQAPNNVNTMAAASIAAHTLGFDRVEGRLIADPVLTDYHIVEVDVWGPGDISTGEAFHVHTTRTNPAKVGHVTGSATYRAFVSSVLGAKGKGPGLHLC